MYLCLCNAITEGDVDRLIHGGCRTLGELYRHLGGQPRCGKCAAELRLRLKTESPGRGAAAFAAGD